MSTANYDGTLRWAISPHYSTPRSFTTMSDAAAWCELHNGRIVEQSQIDPDLVAREQAWWDAEYLKGSALAEGVDGQALG